MPVTYEISKLKLLPLSEYVGINHDDPIRFYHTPIFGKLYRQRVELCLAELSGGERVLEVGFGSGVTFFNLHALYREIHGIDLMAKVDDISGFFRRKGIETYLLNGNVLSMPFYANNTFDSVLLISILEHIQPSDQAKAFAEITRVIKPGGQVVYGVPIERPLMVFFFRLLGYNIRLHHFSTQNDVCHAAKQVLRQIRIINMPGPLGFFGNLYQVGHFRKPEQALS
jgi:ubiquinone/menaquinone biosynthesis C-methylase UbiE